MPISYTIDRDLRVVVARGSGVLSEEDLYGSRERMQSDPAFDPHFAELVDLSEVTEIQVSVPVIARFVRIPTFAPGVRRAIVGPSEVQYDVARMFATFSETHRQVVHVFRDRQVAEAWLSERRQDE
jgi:hypothetical protein